MSRTSAPGAASHGERSEWLKGLRLPGAIVAALLLFGVVDHRVLSVENLCNVAVQSSYPIIFALAQTTVILARGFDLSLGLNVSLVSVVTAMGVAGGNIPLGLACGLGVGVTIGLVNGVLIGVVGVNALVTTLGVANIVLAFASTISGGFPVTGLPPGFVTAFSESASLGLPTPIWIAALLVALIGAVLKATRFGRSLYLIGANPRAAIAVGMGAPYGQAEGGSHLPAGVGVISGRDPFKGGKGYVNQVFVGYAGGGAPSGYDGWLTYCGPANGGLIQLDSVEVDESMYPIIIESRGVIADSQGFGEFEGAPAIGGTFYPLDHDMTIVYAADGTSFPPRGVLGGGDGAASETIKHIAEGARVVLPAFSEEVIESGAKIAFAACSGGGYGEPLRRSPKRVAASVNRGWLSRERAEAVYKVALVDTDVAEVVAVDEARTQALRAAVLR